MLRSPAEFDMPQDPIPGCVLLKGFPSMCVRYVGPIKDYLSLPLFAVFGVHTWIIRAVSILLASVGLFGIGRLAGGVTALLLAINPTYVTMTVFDDDAIAPMMAAVGLLCLGISAYLRQANRGSGPLEWERRRVWVSGPAPTICSSWVQSAWPYCWGTARRRLAAVPLRHWAAFAGGGLLGGSAFLVYQVYSKGGTWQGRDVCPGGHSGRPRICPIGHAVRTTLVGPRAPGDLGWCGFASLGELGHVVISRRRLRHVFSKWE